MLLTAARSAANQEIEMLRNAVITAELASDLEPLEIAIQMMERQLEDSIITAPIDGTITAKIAREGGLGMGLMFVVEDTSSLRIITGFREYDIAFLSQGMEVSISPDGVPGTYTGVISRVSTHTSPFFPVPTFEAEIGVTSEDTDLRIGMTARIDVQINTME
jgi:multidrug resistance efflux pump